MSRNGKHLQITVHWLDMAPFGDLTIEANLHRMKKMPEFHTPGHCSFAGELCAISW
jgi:hypothetical protein